PARRKRAGGVKVAPAWPAPAPAARCKAAPGAAEGHAPVAPCAAEPRGRRSATAHGWKRQVFALSPVCPCLRPPTCAPCRRRPSRATCAPTPRPALRPAARRGPPRTPDMRTILICHAEDAFDRRGLAAWLASFSTLAGIVVLEETSAQKHRRYAREYRRVGALGMLDVVAMRVYQRLFQQAADAR